MDENSKKLTDEEIKEKLLKSHERQLALFYRTAQSDVITSCFLVEEIIEEKNIYGLIKNQEEKDILANSYNKLIKSFNRHNKFMDNEEIENEVKQLLDIRKELYILFSAINSYEVEISYVSEQINYYMMRLSARDMYKNQEIGYREIKDIINVIEEELNNSISEYNTFIETVSQILGILPFRMTKFKYFSIIESTLKRNLKHYSISYVEEEITNNKLIFDSSLMGDYGILFDYCFADIQKFKNIDFKEKSYGELENILSNIDALWDEISSIRGFIYLLGILTNKLISIYLIKNKIELDLLSNNIFDIWLKYQENPNEELLEELILKNRIEFDNIESKFQQEREYLEKIDEEAKEIDENINREIEAEMLSNMKIFKYISDDDFNKYEVLFPENNKIITKDYLEQLIDSLIRYINRSISGMGNIERKIRMRRLLASLVLPFENSEEFIEYINYSLDERVVSKEEILFTIDALYYLFIESKEEVKEGQEL